MTDAERVALVDPKIRHEIYQRNSTGEGQSKLASAYKLPKRTVQAVIYALDESNAAPGWDDVHDPGWRVHDQGWRRPDAPKTR